MGYQITIDREDAKAIAFSGYRYGWSDILQKLNIDEPGTHQLPESVAWQIQEALAEDELLMPLLSPDSNLYSELLRLWNEIV